MIVDVRDALVSTDSPGCSITGLIDDSRVRTGKASRGSSDEQFHATIFEKMWNAKGLNLEIIIVHGWQRKIKVDQET